MARVLIDNGSSLNVMPKSTLNKLYSIGASLRTSPIIVRAFDGSKREVMGEITLPIWIGPTTFNVNFQVMDINPVYSCLLGRPWIHKAGAVPSSLHQKVKLISVKGEEDLMISTPAPVEYVEGNEDALETSFQSLEIAETEHEQEEGKKVAFMALDILKRAEYRPGKGLGRSLDGIAEPIVLLENPGRAGLGFYSQPRPETKRIAKVTPHLYQWFISGGMILPNQVAMTTDQDQGKQEWIYLSSKELTNWESNTLPAPASQITPSSIHANNKTLETDELGDLNDSDSGQNEEASTLTDLEKELEFSDPIQPPEGSTEVIDIGKGGTTREVRIGRNMHTNVRKQVIELLEEYSDVFAWSYHDMPGLDTKIVEHRLPIISGATPVQQQLGRMKPEVMLKIKEEVEKQ
ncbi:hypothetical protein CR513_29432, partial [Mucuna pruriens]